MLCVKSAILNSVYFNCIYKTELLRVPGVRLKSNKNSLLSIQDGDLMNSSRNLSSRRDAPKEILGGEIFVALGEFLLFLSFTNTSCQYGGSNLLSFRTCFRESRIPNDAIHAGQFQCYFSWSATTILEFKSNI